MEIRGLQEDTRIINVRLFIFTIIFIQDIRAGILFAEIKAKIRIIRYGI
mgnify:CR=1 FL=1